MLLNCGVGEDSWESLGLQGDQINLKGNQSWLFIGRADAEAPILWPSEANSQLIGENPDAEKDWRQEEKEMRWLDGITDSIDMSLSKVCRLVMACCGPWGCKESDTTEGLNWTEAFASPDAEKALFSLSTCPYWGREKTLTFQMLILKDRFAPTIRRNLLLRTL